MIRNQLGYVRPDEIIIPLDQPEVRPAAQTRP
jgi:cell division protein FtsB